MRHVELVNHLLRHLARGASLGIHQHVGLAVIRLTDCQQFADLRERVAFVQERAVGMCAHVLPNGFRGCPEANHERMSFEAGEVSFPGGQTPAAGGDRLVTARQFFNDAALPGAKSGLAVLLKDVVDRLAGTRFDDVVGVQKGEMQMLRSDPAGDRFASAHEADECEVPY